MRRDDRLTWTHKPFRPQDSWLHMFLWILSGSWVVRGSCWLVSNHVGDMGFPLISRISLIMFTIDLCTAAHFSKSCFDLTIRCHFQNSTRLLHYLKFWLYASVTVSTLPPLQIHTFEYFFRNEFSLCQHGLIHRFLALKELISTKKKFLVQFMAIVYQKHQR